MAVRDRRIRQAPIERSWRGGDAVEGPRRRPPPAMRRAARRPGDGFAAFGGSQCHGSSRYLVKAMPGMRSCAGEGLRSIRNRGRGKGECLRSETKGTNLPNLVGGIITLIVFVSRNGLPRPKATRCHATACAPGPSSRSVPTGMMAAVADAPWLGPLSPSRAGRDADWHRGPGELGRAGAPYGVLRQGRVPTSGPTAGKRVGRTLPGHPAR
jgi:hypothetical protein